MMPIKIKYIELLLRQTCRNRNPFASAHNVDSGIGCISVEETIVSFTIKKIIKISSTYLGLNYQPSHKERPSFMKAINLSLARPLAVLNKPAVFCF